MSINHHDMSQEHLTGNKSESLIREWNLLSESGLQSSDNEKIWKLTSIDDIDFNKSEAWNSIESRIDSATSGIVETDRTKQSFFFIKMAASFALLIAVSFWYFDSSQNETTKFSVHQSDASIKKIVLADGSIVHLNKNSSLKVFDETATSRKVYLKGEAYFDVAKSNVPFIVELSGSLSVTVLGTEFNIKSGESSLVMVTEGKVKFSSSESEQDVLLSAGQKGVYVSHENKLIKEETFNRNDLAWKTKTLVFKSNSLGEVVNEIEAAYDVQIVVEDASLNNCHVTARFQDKSLQEVLETISLILNVTISDSVNSFVVSGPGC